MLLKNLQAQTLLIICASRLSLLLAPSGSLAPLSTLLLALRLMMELLQVLTEDSLVLALAKKSSYHLLEAPDAWVI